MPERVVLWSYLFRSIRMVLPEIYMKRYRIKSVYLIGFIFVLLTGLLLLTKDAGVEKASAQSNEIIVKARATGRRSGVFEPAKVTIKPGQTVTWVWDDEHPHTVTSDTDLFDSGLLTGKGTKWSHKFDNAGNFPYYCAPHGDVGGIGMAGTVTVAAASATPTPVTQPTPISITINLAEGWNLVSLPVQPVSSSPEALFSSIRSKLAAVFAFDGERYLDYIPGESSGALKSVAAGPGYWVYMSEAGSLKVDGTVAVRSISLKEGWNLAGFSSTQSQAVESAFSSIKGKFSAVYAYDAAKGQYSAYLPDEVSDLKTLEAGRGYWIYADESATWTF
jgi:plastocyanin